MITRRITFLCILCLWFHKTHSQKTIFVSPSASGNQNGLSWQNAYTDLHEALLATQIGDSIFIREGTYRPDLGSNRGRFFEMKSGVHIYGGFSGNEQYLSQRNGSETILSGNIGAVNDSTDNSYTILALVAPDSNTVIDGISFEGGRAYPDSTYALNTHFMSGGAVYLMGASSTSLPIFKNCTFRNNYARGSGGAVYVLSDSAVECSPIFISCKFQNNYAHNNGGAVFSTFKTKRDSPVFSGCSFNNNTARLNGGGFYLNIEDSARVVILRDTFVSNTAGISHGGIGYFRPSNISALDVRIDSMISDKNAGGISPGFALIPSNLFAPFPVSFSIQNSYIKGSKRSSFNNGNPPVYFWFIATDFENSIFKLEKSTIEQDTVVFQSGSTPFTGFNLIILTNNNIKVVLEERYYSLENNVIQNNSILGMRGFNIPRGEFINNIVGGVNGFTTEALNHRPESQILNNIFVNLRLKTKLPVSNFPAITTIQNNIFFNCRDSLNRLFIPFILGSTSTFANNAFDVPCANLPPGISCANGNQYHSNLNSQLLSNYKLRPCSRLIHAGINAAGLPSLDYEGNPRIIDGTVDIGPYEMPSVSEGATVSSTATCASNGTILAEVPKACGPLSYKWVKSDNSTGTRLDSLTAGAYQLSATDTLGRTVVLPTTIQALPPISASTQVTDVPCGTTTGGAATITTQGGQSPYLLKWSDGLSSTSLNRAGLKVGTYAVTITDQLNCSEVLPVVVNALGQLSVLLDGTGNKCFGDSTGKASVTPLNGLQPYQWLWNTGDTIPELNQLPSGLYFVTVSDDLGCSKTLSFPLNQPDELEGLANITASSSVNSPNGNIVLFSLIGGTPPYQTLWSTGDTSTSVAQLSAGFYTVTVTDANDCAWSEMFEVKLIVSQQEPSSENFALQVFPNPADQYLNIRLSESTRSDVQLIIADALGRVLKQMSIEAGQMQFTWAVPDLPNGIFMVSAKRDGQILGQVKVVIQRD